jgi:hypothetical protein
MAQIGHDVSRRIVIEEDCEHGSVEAHMTNGYGWCQEGSRTVLSEPSEEMVERAAEAYANLRPGVGPVTDRKRIRAILSAALFSSDAGEREETR